MEFNWQETFWTLYLVGGFFFYGLIVYEYKDDEYSWVGFLLLPFWPICLIGYIFIYLSCILEEKSRKPDYHVKEGEEWLWDQYSNMNLAYREDRTNDK